LLTRLKAGKNRVILMELPLPPTYNRFGAIQRRLARRQGVLLVPKRVLLGVLEESGATLDSIHLTRAGHDRLAEAVWQTIRPAYR
ncbi:MAG: acyl-CoA thioesterase, partial [Planctomycetia bacterium]|nr:acyl-CoA thioesterase [Planctomycetia bacterium]